MLENFDRKGQLTLFIIIGIVVIVVLAFVFFIRPAPEVPEIEPVGVEQFVENCIEDTLLAGITELSLQGGYIVLPDNYLVTDYGSVGYAYDQGERVLPSIDKIQEDLGIYISETLGQCTDFTGYIEQGFVIEEGEVTVDVVISRAGVAANVRYPLRISRDGTVTNMENFRQQVDARLWDAWQAANAIVDRTLADKDWLDMTYLSEFEPKVEIIVEGEADLVYSIVYDDYTFLTAFRYLTNNAPTIVVEETYNLIDGQRFTLELDVVDLEGDAVTCSDETELFDITEDCVIDFTPEVPGTYSALIIAEDSLGNTVQEEVEFIVT